MSRTKVKRKTDLALTNSYALGVRLASLGRVTVSKSLKQAPGFTVDDFTIVQDKGYELKTVHILILFVKCGQSIDP